MLYLCFEGMKPQIPIKYQLTTAGSRVSDILESVKEYYPIITSDVYFVYNGKRIDGDTFVTGGVIHICPRLMGGKGGFGSMLRAIGAQIEKTTNREACRDLSGRRLRDINEEKRLKNWITKKAEREREAAERKRKKLEKLRSEPKHSFEDKKYEQERSKLTTEVSDAVEKGFQIAACSNAGPSKCTSSTTLKKGFMFEEEELSSGSSLSDSDESPAAPMSESKRKADESDSSESEQPLSKRQCISPSHESSSNEKSSASPSSQNDTNSESN